MNILAFDTSLEKMYVALSQNEKILGAKIIENTQSHYHSAFLISTIKNILKENKLMPKDVNLIATNEGPGSFTGIRACTTVARVFAQANNINIIGVSSLEILSRLFGGQNQGKPVLVVLDARKEMAYVAIFKDKKQVLAPQALLITDIKMMIQNNDYFIITDEKMKEVFGGKSYLDASENLGEVLIKIAFEKSQTDEDFTWSKMKPLYIQPPAITVKKK